MTNMDIKELKVKNDEELRKDLSALQEQSREMRFKLNSGELKNHSELSKVKKTIARILTVLTQRSKQSK